MDINEFREYYINEIKAVALNNNTHPVHEFNNDVIDMMINDYNVVSQLDDCYFQWLNGNKAYKSMKIDAAYLELPTNTLNCLISDFNEYEIENINNEFINKNCQYMLNFFENVLKGFFNGSEESAPYTELAVNIRRNISSINKIHLFIASTNKISERVKTINLPNYIYGGKSFVVELDIIDITRIYNTRAEGFEKEPIEINVLDFGEKGIPCIKAEIEDENYEAYLAVVPGKFLADIYDKYGARLLESNVRSFLNVKGGVNKGIRGTILNERNKFFTYNNGISTTAKNVECKNIPGIGNCIVKFHDLQIINGGQTTASLASARIKDGAALDHIYVQMKLTIIKNNDAEFIRNISKYSNSQNKVTSADLNSNHPFYTRMEDFSRKIYAPPALGKTYQEIWFFERARGQYEQPMMKMTKAKREEYQRVRPKDKKFTKTDLAKYLNSADMKPYYVSWGSEVNATKFQEDMEKMWDKDNSIYNEIFYKDLIAKAILYKTIDKIISQLEWYKENKAYKPQLVTYTFSKLVYLAKQHNKILDYKYIWDKQSIPDAYIKDIELIARQVFNTINDPNRSQSNISSYCKQKACWDNCISIKSDLSENMISTLIDPNDKKVEDIRAKKEQRFNVSLSIEVDVYNKGVQYWTNLLEKGVNQKLLTPHEEDMLRFAIDYCKGIKMATSKQAKAIWDIRTKLGNYGVIV